MHQKAFTNIFAIFVLFTTSLSFAQNKKELLNQIMNLDADYSIILRSPIKTNEEKEVDFYQEGLSIEDVKLGKAIFKAMLLCGIFQEFAIGDQGTIFLLIRYARWKYKQDKETIDFIQYLAKLINKEYACMDKWLDYYKAFLGPGNEK